MCSQAQVKFCTNIQGENDGLVPIALVVTRAVQIRGTIVQAQDAKNTTRAQVL